MEHYLGYDIRTVKDGYDIYRGTTYIGHALSLDAAKRLIDAHSRSNR